MSKQQKGNRESKKLKVIDDGTKKIKKDPKRHDGTVSELFGSLKSKRVTREKPQKG